jgi:hypothetical protein
MKINITLKIDADLLREARVLAAEEGTSISALRSFNLRIRDARRTIPSAGARAEGIQLMSWA